MDRFNLINKNIVITGASSGLGRDCAIECAKMGATLIILGRNNDRLSEVYDELNKHSKENTRDKHLKYSLDLLDNIDQLSSIISDAVQKVGKINGLVHAAGIEKTLPIRALKESDYADMYKLNVISGFELAKIVSKKKNVADHSSFVFISSITAVIGRPGVVSYAASKGALLAGAKSMALELAPKNITVNCISPGTILTPMMVKYLDSLNDEEKLKRQEGFPLGLGEPKDVSNLCIFLLSDSSKWITGQNYIIDGGYTSR
ncbi:SDR family NAD(P)-dependent oxidoreductase [Brumimicrobium mesophilum]|uniref:SDR family NAD(P)-dependent oxidoreductase n=1 Tax=Brumimicrobium mesophilum TaxID=392717 RepID=UPI000D144B57|nr:SDR family oxidoreductase [Brumimicrobium mesophilum]